MSTLRIFISHSTLDNDFGLRFAQDVRQLLGGSQDAVWFDVAGGLVGGDMWWRKIVQEVTVREIFLVILSPDALASSWVNDELTLALRQQKRIIAILLHPCQIPEALTQVPLVSFLPPHAYADAFQECQRLLLQEPMQHSLHISRRAALATIGGAALAGGGAWLFTHRDLFAAQVADKAAAGKLLVKFSGTGPVSWSADSKFVVANTLSGTLGIREALTGKLLNQFAASSEIIAWSPQNWQIAITGGDGHEASIWDGMKGIQTNFRQFTGLLDANGGSIGSISDIAWSPDGSYIAVACERYLSIWDITTDTEVHIDTSYITRCAWSPDGKQLAAAFDDVRIWDIQSRQIMFAFPKSNSPILDIAWSPDKQHIAYVLMNGLIEVIRAEDGTSVYLYDAQAGQAGANTLSSVAISWSPDGQRIASATSDGTVHLWNAFTGGELFIYHGQNTTVGSVRWSPDGKRIASASSYNLFPHQHPTVQLWTA